MYTIYCHIFPNGKRYVGITKTSLSKRFSAGYATCPLMDRAIKKYGWDNIASSELETVNTVEEAEDRERFYISLFQTADPEHGYNILPGGDVSKCELTEDLRYKLGNGQRGKPRSEEEKKHISEGVKRKFSREASNGHYGMNASEETKQKMSISHLESWKANDGRRQQASGRMKARMSEPQYREKVLTALSSSPKRKPGEWSMPEEAKRKLSKCNKGKWMGAKSPCSKPVLQYTLDGQFVKEWENASEVGRNGIADRSNVAACCRGAAHVKTVAGYIWRYKG